MHRERALASGAWDLTKGQGFPGFSQHHENGEWVTTYERNSAGPNVEPLVIVQYMSGVLPDAYLISEEFRLLMNLWEDNETGNFFSVGDDGSKELAIVFEDRQIRIRTPVLRRYQAARQLDLLLFSDTVAYAETDERSEAFKHLNEPDHVEGDSVVFVGTGDASFGKKRVLSRMLVKRVLPAPPQESSGIWPWDGHPHVPNSAGQPASPPLLPTTPRRRRGTTEPADHMGTSSTSTGPAPCSGRRSRRCGSGSNGQPTGCTRPSGCCSGSTPASPERYAARAGEHADMTHAFRELSRTTDEIEAERAVRMSQDLTPEMPRIESDVTHRTPLLTPAPALRAHSRAGDC